MGRFLLMAFYFLSSSGGGAALNMGSTTATGAWFAGPTSTSCASVCASQGGTCEDRLISTLAEMEAVAASLNMLSTDTGLAADSGGYTGAKCSGYVDRNGASWRGNNAWYRSRPEGGPCYFNAVSDGTQGLGCDLVHYKSTDAPFCYCAGVGGAGVGGAGGAGAAVGDPHLQNVHGERFDLMKPGKHVLINIPRGVTGEKSLLQVQAEARHLSGQCADMYFQEVNVTGSWAEANKAGGYHYSVEQGDADTPEWVAFGKVGLKIVHGRTDSGLKYLNVYVKHLGRAGFAVGGLLGEDDHEDVITPPAGCDQRMSLVDTDEQPLKAPSGPSVAVASFA